MDNAIKMVCPICKSARSTDDPSIISCGNCNYEYAFIKFTAGKQSARLLQDKLEAAKRKYKHSRIARYSENADFTLTGNSVSFISKADNVLYIIRGDGMIEDERDVLQYSATERNCAVLHKNGTISADGDNSFGQCNVQGIKEAVFVMCAPNSIYVIEKSGNVVATGAVADQSVRNWKNMKALACGAYHVLGLTRDNTVKIAGKMVDDDIVAEISQWKNVKKIAAATDCSVALFQDGTVSFAGRKSDPRSEATTWENIESISVDSSYVIGITKDDEIRMAGSCISCLDMGRASAREWKDIIAITCSRSGIASIDEQGKLYIVGNFSGELDKVYAMWANSVQPLA